MVFKLLHLLPRTLVPLILSFSKWGELILDLDLRVLGWTLALFFLTSSSMADEGTTPRVFIIGISAAAQEQDGHSKPMKPKTS
jgi:hypothetical protein